MFIVDAIRVYPVARIFPEILGIFGFRKLCIVIYPTPAHKYIVPRSIMKKLATLKCAQT